MTPRRVITFRVMGKPEPKGSTRAFLPKGWKRPIVTADNPAGKEWAHRIEAVAHSLNEPPFAGPIAISLLFRMARPKSKPRRVVHHLTRPDLDKCVRQTLDALTGILFADDAAVITILARKVYAAEASVPGVEITIAEGGDVRAQLAGWTGDLFELAPDDPEEGFA